MKENQFQAIIQKTITDPEITKRCARIKYILDFGQLIVQFEVGLN